MTLKWFPEAGRCESCKNGTKKRFAEKRREEFDVKLYSLLQLTLEFNLGKLIFGSWEGMVSWSSACALRRGRLPWRSASGLGTTCLRCFPSCGRARL